MISGQRGPRGKLTLFFAFKVTGSGFGATSDTDEGSAGSALTASCIVFGAAVFALLKKSSFPEGFGFAGSSLAPSLTSFVSDLSLMSFVSDLTIDLTSAVIVAALDRPGSLFLEVEAEANDFAFADDRIGRGLVRFCETMLPALEFSEEGGAIVL